MVRAVVDVGSNSVLLAVGRQSGGTWEWIHESTRVTALGDGTKTTGQLSPDGVQATLAVLRDFWCQARAAGAATIWAAATMAVRIADDQSMFLSQAQRQATPVFVLSGDDEAELGFLSVAEDPVLGARDALSIIDPGGHSTEIVVARRSGPGWETVFRHSFPFGALGLRENFLIDSSPPFDQRLAASTYLDGELARLDFPDDPGQAVTLGATGVNLVSLREHLATWSPEKIHGSALLYEEVGRAVGWLCDLDDAGRAKLVGLEPGRERTIHGGSLILERSMNAIHAESCLVSTHGWRHALAAHPEFVPTDYLDAS